ncbi:MAG: O-antigen ligase family protein [Ignavibacteriae bacterium]|nr:O-antigen ligase family protein [Ignavibacteriota bacterium]
MRIYIMIGSVILSAMLFFAIAVAEVNPDYVAMVFVVLLAIAAMKDLRVLLVGWFLMSPYLSPFGLKGAANIASNFSHNVIVPVIAIAILSAVFLRYRTIKVSKVDLLWVAFIAYSFVSSFLATQGRYDDMRMIYLIYALPFLLFIVIRNIHVDSILLKMFAYAAIFHLVMLLLIFVYETLTGEVLYMSQLDWNDVGLRRRFAGPFGSPIIVGIFIPIVFLFIYQGFRFNVIPRMVMWGSAVISALLILVTFTRSVWLGAFAAFLYILYRTSEQGAEKLIRVALFIVVVGVIVGVITYASPAVQERLTGEENANFRIVMAQASINMILDSPFVGWGAGTFDEVSDRYLFDALGVYITKDTSHVTILTILAELGIVGAVFYLSFFIFSLRRKGVRITDLSGDDRLIVAINIACVISFVINAFLIDMRFYSVAYAWLFVNLGFIDNIYRDNSTIEGYKYA